MKIKEEASGRKGFIHQKIKEVKNTLTRSLMMKSLEEFTVKWDKNRSCSLKGVLFSSLK